MLKMAKRAKNNFIKLRLFYFDINVNFFYLVCVVNRVSNFLTLELRVLNLVQYPLVKRIIFDLNYQAGTAKKGLLKKC